MYSIFGLATSVFVFLISFFHISGVGNYFLAQRLGLVLWHFWAVGIGGCLVLALLSRTSFQMPKASVPYLLWSGAFVVCAGLSLMIVDRGPVAIDAIIKYVWFFAVTISLVLLVKTPLLRRSVGYGAVAAVLLMSVVTIMEFLDPNFQVIVDRYLDDINVIGVVNRAGAFHINPNENGLAIVLAMFAGVFFLPPRFRFPFVLLAGMAVFATVSRAALTIWALVTLVCFFMGYIAKGFLVGKIFGVGFVCLLGYLLVSGQIPGLVADMGMDELLSGGMKERLSQNFFTQDDGSSQSRLDVAGSTFREFIDSPLSGIGMGTTDTIDGLGSHNQHLKIAAEMGIFGYLAYVALLAVAWLNRSAVAVFFVLFYFLLGLSNHSMLYGTVYAVLIPLSIVFIPEMLRQVPVASRRRRKRRRRSLSTAERQLGA